MPTNDQHMADGGGSVLYYGYDEIYNLLKKYRTEQHRSIVLYNFLLKKPSGEREKYYKTVQKFLNDGAIDDKGYKLMAGFFDGDPRTIDEKFSEPVRTVTETIKEVVYEPINTIGDIKDTSQLLIFALVGLAAAILLKR